MDLVVRLEGEELRVGMAMMLIDPGMKISHAIAAPLRSGVLGLGCLTGICNVDYYFLHAYFIYRDNSITFIQTMFEVLMIHWDKVNLHISASSRSFLSSWKKFM